MKWEAIGADRSTGNDVSVVIEADDEDSAKRRANRRGVVVETVRCLDPDDSLAGQPVLAKQPVMLASRQPTRVIADVIPAMPMPQQPQYAPQQYAPQQTVIVNVAGHGPPRWSGGTAAVLSLIIPGLGQMYKGQVINGLVWLVAVVIGYFCLIIPGIVLHILCVIGAASGDPYRR